MKTFSLLLLDLGLVLVGTTGSTVSIIEEEFLGEEMEYDTTKSGQEEQTIEVLMNLTLLGKNTGLSMSKDIIYSSLLTLERLQYNFTKENSQGNGKEHCNAMVVCRIVSEANGSCKLRNIFVHGSIEMIHGIHKFPNCKCALNLDMLRGNMVEPNRYESPERETTMCQLTAGKEFPRCQYHSVTSLTKMLTVLTGHSLMS
ncbi:probable ribonuclease 11 [Orycteropus afer afer]|uniref:Probable ribonuclease 11 n=1 Tax=Orycteropus afer afer TaxID=1230840 RepID=A0A8B7AP74_ORYAF|nr:probable ribonuclease 11 [Orycteropus afer afer]